MRATAVEHLVGLGRRTIATITGPLNMCAGIDRSTATATRSRAAGLRSRKALVEEGDFCEESGYRAMGRLLARRQTSTGSSPRPT